jgi:hypothetical protein
LADALESTVRETPGYRHKAKRVAELLNKAGPAVAKATRDIFVEVCSESVKKLLWA